MRISILFSGILPYLGLFRGDAANSNSNASAIDLSNLEPFEALPSVPRGWIKVGTPKWDTKILFRIAVAQPNQALFEQTLLEVSTPSHPRYGQHLERDDLKAMLRPKAESTELVLEWLDLSGIRGDDIEDDGEWINFNATIAQAEKMMDTEFSIYQSSVVNRVKKIRTLQYSVPKALVPHIDMIQPTIRFGEIKPQVAGSLIISSEFQAKPVVPDWDPVSCNSTITPSCLIHLYNIKGYTPKRNLGDFIGVNGFLEQYARYADMDLFLSEYAPWASGANFTWESVNGGLLDQNSTESSQEANLDTQYALSLSHPINNHFYSTPGRGYLHPDLDQPWEHSNENEPYLDYFTHLLKLPNGKLPKTLSTSYGENEQSVPASYAKTVCNMIGQLGARGVSVIFSSGDTGVGQACQTNDGKNTTRFLPIFPAACPYATSVGGTWKIPEQAISFSSGGFSDIFSRPSWQDNAIKAYLRQIGDTWKGFYNPYGRGFPDVAAQAFRFVIVDQGFENTVSGTSASAPVFASIVALINNARMAARQAPMGFLNPWIYSLGYRGMNDVTLGGSKGCTGWDQQSGLPAPYVRGASWNATTGWDPVTGWGTPDFQKLYRLAFGRGF